LGVRVHGMPSIRLEMAGGGTAGLAQLGIVVFDLGGVRMGALGMVVGAMWIPGLRMVKGVNWHVWMWEAVGSGAGGGAFDGMCCKVGSSWGGGSGC